MPGFLEMSDEEFAKQTPPPVVAEEATSQAAAPTGAVSTEEVVTPTPVEPVVPEAEEEVAPVEPVSNAPAAAVEETTPPAVTAAPVVQSPAPAPAPVAVAPVAQTPAAAPATEVDYKAFYERMTAPFKANGKTIQMHTPEEVEQLMKMGANYTQKMQAIAPHRKMLMMLDNNGLLDEGKLSYLIDLDKKNPEAIKKLLKDSGIDPLTIDTTAEPAYQAGSHGVTDTEFGFRTALDELVSTEEGRKTAHVFNTEWDQASKEVLWKEPQVMSAIHIQRENGIYDRISAEVNRQRILGAIGPSVPFILAYKQVGDVMQAQGAFADIVTTTPATPAPAVAKQPLAVKAIAPKPPVTNSSQAAAASQQRTSPKPASGAPINPLAMSDDEFLKQMQNRL